MQTGHLIFCFYDIDITKYFTFQSDELALELKSYHLGKQISLE